MALTKGFVQNAAMGPLDARFFTAGMLQKNNDNSVRLGQLWGSAAAVAGTSSMTVTITDGSYWVVSRGTTDGSLVVANNGTATVTIPAAPSANSRYDAVWVKHNDSTAGDADSNPLFGVTSGTAAASPTIPAIPVGALRLANVLVPAGAASTNASGVSITNVYQFTALSGSPIRYRSVPEMLADAANVVDGAQAYIKSGGLYWMQGGIWHIADGDVFGLITGTGTVANGTTNIAFPGTSTGAFTSNKPLIDLSSGATFIINASGYYQVTATANWGNNSTGERFIEIMANGSSIAPVRVTDRRAASVSSDATINGFVFCNAGDRLTMYGWQSSGGSLAMAMRFGVKLLALS